MKQGFQCKQFFVGHDLCAMKVGTDSLVLGSWAPVTGGGRHLDIGCGSGLLSLMLRQRAGPGSRVIGIDIDEPAVQQSRKNVAQSPWPEDIAIIHSGLDAYVSSEKFDSIVCNPPYFATSGVGEHSHLPQTKQRQTARQQTALPPTVLFTAVAGLLNKAGHFSCLYPAGQEAHITAVAAQYGLAVKARLALKSTFTKPAHVIALTFVFARHNRLSSEELNIRDAQNKYTDHYKALCQPFYLAF